MMPIEEIAAASDALMEEIHQECLRQREAHIEISGRTFGDNTFHGISINDWLAIYRRHKQQVRLIENLKHAVERSAAVRMGPY